MKSDLLLTTPILADEVSAGSVVAGTGMSTALLLFFDNSIMLMIPYFIVCFFVIALDLWFGIRAAKKRGEQIRVSRAIRRTIGKGIEYVAWSILASTISVATGYGIIQTIMMLVVIGIEIISIGQNWYFVKFGKVVKVDALKIGTAVLESKTGVDVRSAVKVERGKKDGNDKP